MTKPKPRSTPTALPRHPEPPAGIPASAVALWEAIVRDHPAKHFRGANLALLERFCHAWVLVGECDLLIAEHGLLIDGKANPAVRMRSDGSSEMQSLATKLRICISATRSAGTSDARPNPDHSLRKPWEA